jgi:hypothetical protein
LASAEIRGERRLIDRRCNQAGGVRSLQGSYLRRLSKDPADPQWRNDPAMQAWNIWMDKYNPHINKSDYYAPYGYNIAYAVTQIIKQCGDNLTRENIMNKASPP